MRKSTTHGFTRRNVRLPDEIWNEIALIAVKTGKDLSEVMLDAARRYTEIQLPVLFCEPRTAK